MPRLDPMPDTCRTAIDVRAHALAVFQKRRAAYERLSTEPSPAEEPAPDPTVKRPAGEQPIWRRLSVASELARQLGVPREALQKGAGRGLPWVVFRELGMALAARLSRQSLNEIGRAYGGLNHSTVLSAKRAMAAILNAAALDEMTPASVWVETCLPLAFVEIARRRRACANRVVSLDERGKFAVAREQNTELPPEAICGNR
jgi:hypothetical protein